MTMQDLERYLDEHGLELRVKKLFRRWSAALTLWGADAQEWRMEGDDLKGAIDSAIEAHRACTGPSGRAA